MREQFAVILKSLDIEVEDRDDSAGPAGPGAASPEAVPLAPADELDLGDLEADGRDWAGFSVDQSLSEDTTMVVALAEDDFGLAVTVPATGEVLTRRELLADLLRAVVANLNANPALLESERLRQQVQVGELVRAMMNSLAASAESEALAEDTAGLIMRAMSAAGQGSLLPPKAVRGG